MRVSMRASVLAAELDLGVTRPSEQAELRQRGHAIVKTDLRDDLAVLEPEHGRSGEPHLAAGGCRQRSHQEVAEGRPGVRAAAFPAADDIVALGDQIRRTPEIQIRNAARNRS